MTMGSSACSGLVMIVSGQGQTGAGHSVPCPLGSAHPGDVRTGSGLATIRANDSQSPVENEIPVSATQMSLLPQFFRPRCVPPRRELLGEGLCEHGPEG